MKNRYWGIILVSVISILFISTHVSAAQYDPPWADNFGFEFSDFDTTDYASDAEGYQDYVGYQASSNDNWDVFDAVSLMDDDAIWTSSGHGRAGAVLFEDSSDDQTELVANLDAAGWRDYARLDEVNDLSDLRLLTFIGCNTSCTQGNTGNLLNVANSMGVDATIGFSSVIYQPQADAWGSAFFYNLAIDEETVAVAASDSVAAVVALYL